MLDQHPAWNDSSGLGRRWFAWLLIVAGVAMLSWSAALVIDARVAQDAARRSLDLASPPRASVSPRDAIGAVNLAPPRPIVARGSPIGELLIPRVHLSSIVLHGSDTQTLRRGPGHLEQTALPGEPGNVAIAGHRDTFFRQLRDVKVGDDIFLNTARGRFHYQIAWAHVVGAHDVSVLEPTTVDALTLVTCYPFWVLGPAPDRFVVRATRIEDGPEMVVAPEPRPAAVDLQVGEAHVETPAVVAHEPAAVATPSGGSEGPPPRHDDDALIRAAIERFRVAYNAWIFIHERGTGPLRFSGCDIAIAGRDAVATCESSMGHTRTSPRRLRQFTLERVDRVWTIRSTTDSEAIVAVSDSRFAS